MLDALKRWIAGASESPQWRAVADWATARSAEFKRARDGEGFVVDGALEGRAWRLEWGPPQRAYIEGQELRLRMELGLQQDLNLLLLSRALMETLERQTFERYTEQLQTQIDLSTPEEMRWLAMFPKVPLVAPIRGRFGAVAAMPELGTAWIAGALCDRLAEVGALLDEATPLVLMTLRGRLYLRTQLPQPEVARLDALVRLFEAAAAQAVRASGGPHDGPDAWPSTGSTAWQTQLQPEPAKD